MSERVEEQQIEPQDESKSVVDPLAQMVQFYEVFSKSWAEVMSSAVASKSFAESMGRQMETSLDTLTLFRRQMGSLMEQYLQQMSLPTRSDLTSLAERLTNLEMAIDDLDAKLDEVLRTLKAKKDRPSQK